MELIINEIMTNPNKITDVFLITKEFYTPTEFSQHIEKTANMSCNSCWDILIDYCSSNNIEPESMSKLINASLKAKIESEVLDLNLIKGKKPNKLPF